MTDPTFGTPPAPAAAEPADVQDSVQDVVPAGPPGPGNLVLDTVHGRYGIVVDSGRRPGFDRHPETGEQVPQDHEPLVCWLGPAAEYDHNSLTAVG